jgi:hypothetical protein
MCSNPLFLRKKGISGKWLFAKFPKNKYEVVFTANHYKAALWSLLPKTY